MIIFRSILVGLALVLAASANDVGGGASGIGAAVTLATTASTTTLSNGVITAVIQNSTAKVSSYLFNGFQMVDPSNPIYYSMDGGTSYDTPSNCIYSLTTATPDMVDVSFKRTWTAAGAYKHVFDIEIHFVLRRGDTGLYSYAILDHPAAYPAATVGEWRIVWKLPRSSTTFTFERAYVDAARHWEMPSYYDYQQASATGIAEIVKLNTGVRAGEYDGKYSYSARYSDIGTWGHASNIARKGVWFVLGGEDYLNDGPTKQDLTLSESYILMHFGRNHYNGSGTSVATGEAWRKQYGPFLLYCNGTATTTAAGDTLWEDAKAQVTAEKSAWPYSWLTNADHPATSGRGTVTGKLVLTDALKSAVSAANASVGLAAPEDTNGNWQFQGKGYQYWTHADAAGNFTIPAVRPGTYTLYAFNTGAVGEFTKTNVTVTASGTNALGTLTWNISHGGTSLAWEIGIPDRSAAEFKHGDDYFKAYLWNNFPTEFTNPLIYQVGTSSPAANWNYVHCSLQGTDANGATTYTPWNWQVKFNLAAVPLSGNATLTVAVASSHYARLFLTINDDSSSFARISPPVDGGNALLRQGIHAKYSVVTISIPVSKLRVGSNTFHFGFSGSDGASHVMYDYLGLALPDFPPPPPSSGRDLVWKGGSTALENTWDLGTTSSLLDGVTPVSFAAGDAVSFNDSGSNTTSITLTGSLEPDGVGFSGTKNFTLAGTGSLTGLSPLVKSGTGTLTISNAHSFSGGTTIHGGILAISNAGSLGTGAVTLNGGTWATGKLGSANAIVVTADSTITGGDSGGAHGIKNISGAGTLTMTATNVFDLEGSLAAFNGTAFLNGTGSFRFNGSNGSAASGFNLGTRTLSTRTGTVFSLGSLAGATGSILQGATGYTANVVFTIGGNQEYSSFAGVIANGSGMLSLVKTGNGTLALTGNCTYSGSTSINMGTLRVEGALATGAVSISQSGSLSGSGNLGGPVTSLGTISPGLTTGTLTMAQGLVLQPSAVTRFDLGSASDRIDVAGNLALAGEIEINAVAGFTPGTYTLFNYTGTLVDNGIGMGAVPADHAFLIDTSVAGQVRLMVTPTLSPFELWQLANFKSTSDPQAAATADADGDGQSNWIEFLTGTEPNNGSSLFAASINAEGANGFTLSWPSVPGKTYGIETTVSLAENWTPLVSVPAATAPATTTQHSIPSSGITRFYRVVLQP